MDCFLCISILKMSKTVEYRMTAAVVAYLTVIQSEGIQDDIVTIFIFVATTRIHRLGEVFSGAHRAMKQTSENKMKTR